MRLQHLFLPSDYAASIAYHTQHSIALHISRCHLPISPITSIFILKSGAGVVLLPRSHNVAYPMSLHGLIWRIYSCVSMDTNTTTILSSLSRSLEAAYTRPHPTNKIKLHSWTETGICTAHVLRAMCNKTSPKPRFPVTGTGSMG